MPRRFNRITRFFLLAAAGLPPYLLLAALCAAQEQKPAKPDKSLTAGKKFKNVKILKDLSEDELFAVMGKFDKALHVGCGYCHISDKFRTFDGYEKDDKPAKRQARQMMLMTRDLNKRYKTAAGKVTCWTCHAGKRQPDNAPPAQ